MSVPVATLARWGGSLRYRTERIGGRPHTMPVWLIADMANPGSLSDHDRQSANWAYENPDDAQTVIHGATVMLAHQMRRARRTA